MAIKRNDEKKRSRDFLEERKRANEKSTMEKREIEIMCAACKEHLHSTEDWKWKQKTSQAKYITEHGKERENERNRKNI